MSSKRILVAGASRGVGLAVAEHLVWQCDRSKLASPSFDRPSLSRSQTFSESLVAYKD
jgi:hypothetical protein